MPSRRQAIRMTPQEVSAYLHGHSRIILVTNGPAGLPHAVPMNYGVDEQERIVMTAFRKSQKVRNLERDPRASLLVESGMTYAELKAVLIYADAEIITDPDMVAGLMGQIGAEAELAGSIAGGISEQVRASIAKRAILRFTPFRYVSWDHSRLAGHY